MTDFGKLLGKAKEFETNIKETQEKIKKIEVEGVSGGNKVKIKLNGEGEMIHVTFSPELFQESQSIIEDLIVAAHNNAKQSLKQKVSEEMSKVTGGFNLPGFKWPL